MTIFFVCILACMDTVAVLGQEEYPLSPCHDMVCYFWIYVLYVILFSSSINTSCFLLCQSRYLCDLCSSRFVSSHVVLGPATFVASAAHHHIPSHMVSHRIASHRIAARPPVASPFLLHSTFNNNAQDNASAEHPINSQAFISLVLKHDMHARTHACTHALAHSISSPCA
jgi:hypothetical protein